MTPERRQRQTSATIGARAEALVIRCRIEQGKLGGLHGLRACRERAGYTQKKLAEVTGLSKPTLQQWESARHWPSAYQLPLLAGALGVSIEELYLGPEDTA